MSKKIVTYTLLLTLIGCGVSNKKLSFNSTGSDVEYYNTFTEATKHALLGNYKSALALFSICIENNPEKAAPYYQISNIYLSVKDLNKSKYFAKHAVDRNDKNKWYLIHLANLYQYEKNVDSVIYLYEKIVDITDNSEYKYNLALFYSSKGNVRKSMKLIDELEHQNDGMRELIMMKHKNYAALNEKDSAVYQLERIVKMFPDELENYGLLAEYLSEINRDGYAKEIYNKLLQKDPRNGLANISYGDFYKKQGRKDSAYYYYKRGIESDQIRIEDKIGLIFNFMYDPITIKTDTLFIEELLGVLKKQYKEDRPYTLSAEYFVKRKKYNRAIEELEGAINYNSDAYVVWEQYIMISNFLGKYEKVYKVHERAMDKFPDKPKVYVYAGYSLYKLDSLEKSIYIVDKGLEIKEIQKEDKIQLLNQKADAFRGLEKYDESDSIYEEILKIDPNNMLVRNNYGYYLSVRNKNLERAEELSRYTVKKEPKNATYLDTYGWILFKMGNAKEALKYVQWAIQNGAYNSAEVLDHYGDIIFELNKCKEAIEAWNEAIKADSLYKEDLEIKIIKAENECE